MAAHARSRGRGRSPPPPVGYRELGNALHFRSHGLAAVYDPMRGVVLNGADVASFADGSGSGFTLAQGTPAVQPLATGAPTYNGSPSIQFKVATLDVLTRANTALWVGTAGTLVFVSAPNVASGQSFAMSNTDNQQQGFFWVTGPTGRVMQVPRAGTVGSFGFAAPQSANGVPEVVVYSQSSGTAVGWINALARSVTPAGTPVFTGVSGAATLNLGFPAIGADMDFLFAAYFTSAIPADVVYRISHARCASAGVAFAA